MGNMFKKPTTTIEYKAVEKITTIDFDDYTDNKMELAKDLIDNVHLCLPEEHKFYLLKFLSSSRINALLRKNILKYYEACSCELNEDDDEFSHNVNCILPIITKQDFLNKASFYLKLYNPRLLEIPIEDDMWTIVDEIYDSDTNKEDNEILFENTLQLVNYYDEQVNLFLTDLCNLLSGLGKNVCIEHFKIKEKDHQMAFVYIKATIK